MGGKTAYDNMTTRQRLMVRNMLLSKPDFKMGIQEWEAIMKVHHYWFPKNKSNLVLRVESDCANL